MNPYARFALVLSVLAAIVLAGCSAAAPMATRAPAATQALKALAATPQREAIVPAPAAAPIPAPAATMLPADAGFGPSTGGTTEPNGQPYGDVFFKNYGVNPFIDTEDDHFSTFAVDVDTASYTVMRRFVGDGNLPPSEAVRVEEYVNYFKQDYQPPAEGEGAFAIHLEGAPSPYGGERYYLARVGLKGYEVPAEERKDVVLTFVIDVSGSMARENRLGLVKQALRLLVQELRPTDKVGIAVYGSNGRTLLEHTAVADGERILQAIDQLQPEGATNAEQGLVIGYGMAAKAFDGRAINRVILCSDGVANVGQTASDTILKQIRRYAEENIYLTTVGFGMGNYNDVLLEQLADDGNGFYAYVDTLDEAERLFVHDLTSTLQVIAKDAKIQVDFNPAVVKSYRLMGYENRDVADQDFRNDEVDAGEIGVGHSVTALYEIKFQADAPESDPALTVYVRYQDPDTGEVTEISRSLTRAEFASAFEDASSRFQLDAVVAEYAEILHESYWAKGSSLAGVAEEARRVAKVLPRDPDVVEFAGLVERAASLQD
jgi:Ca-activated chloride channel family protein